MEIATTFYSEGMTGNGQKILLQPSEIDEEGKMASYSQVLDSSGDPAFSRLSFVIDD